MKSCYGVLNLQEVSWLGKKSMLYFPHNKSTIDKSSIPQMEGHSMATSFVDQLINSTQTIFTLNVEIKLEVFGSPIYLFLSTKTLDDPLCGSVQPMNPFVERKVCKG